MTRIAVLADVHGNLIALEAVLAEIRATPGIDQSVCLGDVCGLGPHPREVLGRLQALAPWAVMGNADEFLINPHLLDPDRHPGADKHTLRLHAMERWAAAQLTDADREYLRSFRPVVELPLGGTDTMLCYHGSPLSAWEEIRASTPDEELARLLGPRRTVLMAGGHTHEQFVRRLDQTIVMNPGSVGLAYETIQDGGFRNPPWAEYAVVTAGGGHISVDLRRVPIDQAAVRAALLRSGMPHAKAWAADWR